MSLRLHLARPLAWLAFALAGLGFASPPARADLLLVASAGSNAIESYDLASGAYLGRFASGAGLNNPVYMVEGPDGDILVSNFLGGGVSRFDVETGAFLGTFTVGGGIDGAVGLTFGPDGHLYVSSFNTNSIKRFDGRTGVYLDDFVAPEVGFLLGPDSLSFDRDGFLYVSSLSSSRVKIYDPSGDYLGNFAVGNGLQFPTGLLFADGGNTLLVGSGASNEVKRYDTNTGQFLGNFLTAADGIQTPIDLVFDGTDLLVSNFEGGSVGRYDSSGTLVRSYTGSGQTGAQGLLILRSVPEPGSMALSALGLTLVGVRAIRARRPTI